MSQCEQFQQFRLIAGHFSLPSHELIARDRYSLTVLRDPIRTIFSTYTFWRGAPEQNLATLAAKNLSFPDFVKYFECSPAVISNPFTHHFAGLSRELACDDTSGPTLLAMAKHNLSAFHFVGICEEFERSARLLCRELSWHVPVPLPHENRSGSEKSIADIDERTMEILRERSALDFELYAYAVAIFGEREQASLDSAGSRHDVDVACEGAGGPCQGPRDRSHGRTFLPFPAPSKTGRQARVEAAVTSWLPDEQSRLLELAVRFRTKVEIPDLILGVAIFDASGNNLWGTNTALEGLELRNEPDCTCCASFLLHCSAPLGIYSVTVALHQPRNLGFHDHWLDRATSFEVTKPVDCLDVDRFKLRHFWSKVEDFRGQGGKVALNAAEILHRG